MAVYDQFNGISSIMREAYEVEMTFFNPDTLDLAKRTSVVQAVDHGAYSGIENQIGQGVALNYIADNAELEGYYLASCVIRRVDVVSFLPYGEAV